MLYCVLEASFLCNVASNYHVGMSDDKHCRPWVMVILLSGRRSSNRGACVYHHTCTETLGHKYIYGYIYIPYQEYISYVLLVLCKLGRAPAVGLVYVRDWARVYTLIRMPLALLFFRFCEITQAAKEAGKL